MSAKSNKADSSESNSQSNTERRPKCGIIMPIADNPDLGYPLGHWAQVREIIISAAETNGFDADMVSNDTQVDIIHSTIIKNIYANDVAVCDVSTRNANVMFELGLRIASKKPVILIKDEATPYSFDTQLIPHISYRRDLRLYETLNFQKELGDKILIAYQESQQPGYTSFLGQFTSYTLAQIDEQQVGVPEYFTQVAGRMQNLEDTIKILASAINNQQNSFMMVPSNVDPSLSSGALFASGFSNRRPKPKNADQHITYYLQDHSLSGPSKLSRIQKSDLIDSIMRAKYPEIKDFSKSMISQLIDEWMPF
ncbi:hypothetical protein [Hymenobacter rigui]|uniref:RNA helicase n=1 Tax=Hymenobacter rigui TaxID=334424 RepID=A0A428KFX9_9BACT|nr:hypothetical protein [Hymenobacter rigui]RSK45205.1 hypothetical protein EI291_19020 [Hymenobacter rigui]